MNKAKRLIIRCPDCESKGFKQNLAEVLTTGVISVQRIRTGKHTGSYKDYTLVFGDNIGIICGNCGNIVYKRVQR